MNKSQYIIILLTLLVISSSNTGLEDYSSAWLSAAYNTNNNYSKIIGYGFVTLSLGYFFYKMGLMVKYGYESSQQMYHQNEPDSELPDDVKRELDIIMSSQKVQKLIQKYNRPYYRMWGTLDRSMYPAYLIFKELGLCGISSAFIIQDNALLKDYILKMPTNFRLRTAKAIENIIRFMQLKHVAIPKKYSYRLLRTDLNIVISEKIPENVQVKRDLSNEEIQELLVLATVLNYKGIAYSDFKPENLIFTKDTVYIIDSELSTGKKFIFKEWPVQFWGQSKPNSFHFIERLSSRFEHPFANNFRI